MLVKYVENEVASFYYSDAVFSSITKLCLLVKNYPFIIKPVRNDDEEIAEIYLRERFYFYPTQKKTTLFYDQYSDCFFKILHPANFKNRFLFFLINPAKSIYNLSKYLLSKDIKVSMVMAYGEFKKFRKPFFVMKRIAGKSLHKILIREKKTLTMEIYLKALDEIIKLHSLGYWFGDAHLSHIFLRDSEVSGFIDIDSIRRNRLFSLKNHAKDLAGLNHPELPLTKEERRELLDYYIKKSGIKDRERFLKLVHFYSDRRWGNMLHDHYSQKVKLP
jgi:tRNA A-37 threonylcarbamoyl transferase component Bud32